MRTIQRTKPSKVLIDRARRVTPRAPNFDSGIIDEPLLSFGGQHTHVDPKSGLALYGPYTTKGQRAPHLRSIVVGIVGPPGMIADAEAWLRACQGVIVNEGTQPFLYPHFPGFDANGPMQCDLVFGESWRESIKESKLNDVIRKPSFTDRVKEVVALYLEAVTILAGREPKPNVVLCCIPQSVVDTCTVQRAAERRLQKLQAKASRRSSRHQLSLFSDEEESSSHQNLRRGLKAEAMQVGMPTQLVWPRTLRLAGASTVGALRTQDDATRAWNFTTALYHKAGGSPWRLSDLDAGVCFVGLSFFHDLVGEDSRMRTSMAQAFTAAGDGYVLRGDTFEWEEAGRSPHLDKKLAASLLRDVIELYRKQNRGSLPSRLVVHKSSVFWDEELAGLQEASALIPQKDFVAIGSRDLQFYRRGDYPALRGTYVKFSDTDLLLYTSGYVPYLRTYPGARVPRPLEVLEHFGDSPWDVVLKEILALTKMNWNTADFSGRDPITLAFSRRVGQVLAEVSPGGKVLPEYRFYM
jgi:hypothetical protein